MVVNDEMQQRKLEKCRTEYYSSCFLDHPTDEILSCAYIEKLKSKSLNIVSIFFNEILVSGTQICELKKKLSYQFLNPSQARHKHILLKHTRLLTG